MTTLNVILDDIVTPPSQGAARYTEELARALIGYAPANCFVEGVVASSTDDEYADLEDRLPGLAGLFKSALVRRDLTTAWQHGFTAVPTGMLHAPSLFAPLRRHDRVNQRGNQIVVSIQDSAAWLHPEFLSARELSWTKAMAARAVKYADAVVVPTHAVAEDLEQALALGDRLRVINAAPGTAVARPDDAPERLKRLGLPERYLVSVGDSGPRQAIAPLLAALAKADGELTLAVVGAENEPGALERAIAEANLDSNRVVGLGVLDAQDYSAALSGSLALIYPSLSNGFGTPMLDAFALGVPVVHAATRSLVEVAGDAGLAVPVDDADAFPTLLAEAIDRLVGDSELRSTLSILGEDRAHVFTWRAAAEGVWQLHAAL